MDSASALVAALEALNNAALAPYASRLAHLARVAGCSSHRFCAARVSLDILPEALIARILSYLPATHLARVARLSTAFHETYVPASVAMRASRLHLNQSYDYHSPFDLLLGETEATAGAHMGKMPTSGLYGIGSICPASAQVLDSLPAQIHGEFVFSLSLINLLFKARDDGLPGSQFEAGAQYKHVFYIHSDVVPSFPLTEDARKALLDPRKHIASLIGSTGELDTQPGELVQRILDEEGSQAVVCAYLSVTQALTGKTIGLLQSPHCEEEENIEVTYLMPPHHVSEHDELTHGGYMVGITKYYMQLRFDASLEEAIGNDEEGDEGAAGEEAEHGGADTKEISTVMRLNMWSEVHSGGPFGGECFGHKEYGVGDLNDTLMRLLRNIDFGTDSL